MKNVLSPSAVRKLQQKLDRLSKRINRINTAKSPTLLVSLQKKRARLKAVIDEGAEMSCIARKTADAIGIAYRQTSDSAQGAGSSDLILAGETEEAVILRVLDVDEVVYLDLGICAVVENLTNERFPHRSARDL